MGAVIVTVHTADLDPAELTEIRALLDAAFKGGFSDDDWDHSLGGIHALIRDADGIAAHGSVVQRRALHAGRSYRVGYVEGVAVRADRHRQGLGGRIMEALEQVIDRAYEFGALSASSEGAGLYASRGWQVWPGRLGALGPEGVVPLPEEEGTTYVRPLVGDPALPLLFDWRDGDVL
ncbi:GNAT family N-acetyltransferase [Streptomyces sp. NBC_01465]|uniref:GNAT family N-acetyltransferase n=1 Tax=Streptomyces sp. NBC_01465 TaxID=2903878 RepID=UPI002E357B1E|nr:GNAT family N-acetyltransferase [Streptomyces sp. NBC_01465]